MGLLGLGTLADPCYTPVECQENEIENYCINTECFKTCETVLNYLDPICNSDLNFTMRALRDDCRAGCLCADGYVRAELDNAALCILPEDCSCPEGYDHTIDVGCEDIDECALGTNDCSALTEDCVNTKGSYECVCADGFKPARRLAFNGAVSYTHLTLPTKA